MDKLPPNTPVYPHTREDLLSYLGESIHTAFRKATYHPAGHRAWEAIQELSEQEPDDWQAVLKFVALTTDGWGSPPVTYGLHRLLLERNLYRDALATIAGILTAEPLPDDAVEQVRQRSLEALQSTI